MRYGQFNEDFLIVSFGTQKLSEKEPVYQWIMELEYDESDD